MTTHPVTIENDAVRMDVWPTLGGKVSSIIDKADKFELLFNYPCELLAVLFLDWQCIAGRAASDRRFESRQVQSHNTAFSKVSRCLIGFQPQMKDFFAD